MEFKNYTIDRFLTELKGDLSSPGGGSTAALVGSLAASLNSMVYSFTIDRKSFEALSDDNKKKMREFKEKSDSFIEMGLSFMEADRETFMELMDTFKLPKNTEEEKKYRSKEIRDKTIKAMEVPLQLAKKCLELYDNIDFSIRYGNKNLTSDGVVAGILLHSTIEAAIVNVLVNFNSLIDKSGYEDLKEKCQNIINESLIRKTSIINFFSI